MSRAPELRASFEDEIVVDSFAGGGGASLGISWALGRGPDIAINHDAEAIALHKANHPETEHHTEDVWKVDPVEACQGRRVGLMWLSPDCKHFSKAKGGKPVSKKIRGLAWVAIRWAAAVKPRVIVLENVEEFQTWGPVLATTNKPCPERKGKTFRAFIAKLRKLGYAVEWKELRACDYGTPTIRKRLFIIARCDGQPIVWPKPTHGKTLQPWRTAAECIQWEIACPSIFTRKKALAENTLKRIARGLKKFVIESPRPFIVGVGGRQGQSPERSVDRPYQTITSKADSAIVVPYIATLTHHGSDRVQDLTQPFPTVTGAHRGEQALIAPTLIQRYGENEKQAPRASDITKPMNTVVPTGNGANLVAAFLAKHYKESSENDVKASSLFDPAPTVMSTVHHSLVTSHLMAMRGTEPSHLHGDSMTEPMRTVSASGNHAAEVRAFLVQYYSEGSGQQPHSLQLPLGTVTSRDRYGLVTVEGIEYHIADIGMRMLEPRELYRAQGFPDTYRIDVEMPNGKRLTKTAQVRCVGNSVCPPLARAIVAANYRPAQRSSEAA
jgi:DNA (cytosine-5)-methyltransferase 1